MRGCGFGRGIILDRLVVRSFGEVGIGKYILIGLGIRFWVYRVIVEWCF